MTMRTIELAGDPRARKVIYGGGRREPPAVVIGELIPGVAGINRSAGVGIRVRADPLVEAPWA